MKIKKKLNISNGERNLSGLLVIMLGLTTWRMAGLSVGVGKSVKMTIRYAGALKEHPQWYLRDKDGELIFVYDTPSLDCTNPEVLEGE